VFAAVGALVLGAPVLVPPGSGCPCTISVGAGLIVVGVPAVSVILVASFFGCVFHFAAAYPATPTSATPRIIKPVLAADESPESG
jgi:hypothetical protein